MGEDSRVPPLSRRVPGATDRDRPEPARRITQRRLPEALLLRMQAAIAAAPEQAAGQEQAERAERPAALSRRVPDASEGQRLSASSLAGIFGLDAETQPIPIVLGRASRGILSPVEEIGAQPEPAAEPQPEPPAAPEPPVEPEHAEPEPAAQPEPEPLAESEPAAQPEPAAEPEPPVEPEREPSAEPEPPVEPEREPSAEPEPAAQPWADHESVTDMRAPPELAAQRIGGRKEQARRHYRVAGVVAVVTILIASGSLAFALSRRAAPASTAASAATRNHAAAWVAAQVGRATTVSCDPVMCQVLQAHGLPARDLLQLTPKEGNPRGSKVIVATPAIRSQFGSSIGSAYAPLVLASFGTGNLRIDIRVIASHGPVAYQSALRKDLRARIATGAALLDTSRVMASAAARRQLSDGQVDSRLLLTIYGMAAKYPVDIVAFSDSGPAASAGSPLRAAELAPADEAPHTSTAVFMRAMFAVLRTQTGSFAPAHAMMTRLDGNRTVLYIEFAAPSPLGLLGKSTP